MVVVVAVAVAVVQSTQPNKGLFVNFAFVERKKWAELGCSSSVT